MDLLQETQPSAGSGAAATSDRIHAATALRTLAHAFVAHRAPSSLLRSIADAASGFTSALLTEPGRTRPVDELKRGLFETDVPDGHGIDHFPDCVVSGLANPMGIAIRVRREGEEAVASVVLGPAFEGAPGRAHGGIVAAVFDDTMGFVLSMLKQPAFTGQLTVTYRAPTPVGEALEFRARLVSSEGRKLVIGAEATSTSDVVVAEATGLFIAIPAERFGEARKA
jgi:acyl-coenzyme A thioesterase PaaI-like protein